MKDLSMIQSVFSSATSGDMEFNKYAIGFTSVDFIMWDMTNEMKVLLSGFVTLQSCQKPFN